MEDVEESRRLQEEKQAKAQLQRSLYLEEKAQKSKLESDKVAPPPPNLSVSLSLPPNLSVSLSHTQSAMTPTYI